MQVTGVGSAYGGVDVSQFMTRMKRTEPSAGDMAEFLIKQKDTDGDGALSASELGAQGDMFSEIDSDGNGSLTLEELTTDAENRRADMERQGFSPGMPPSGLMGMGQMSASDMASSLLENSDEDGDSMLSVSETKFSKDEFSGIDSDGDGKLSLDELTSDAEKRISEMAQQGPPPPPPPNESGSNSASSTNSYRDLQALFSALSGGIASSNGGNTSSLLSLLDTQA